MDKKNAPKHYNNQPVNVVISIESYRGKQMTSKAGKNPGNSERQAKKQSVTPGMRKFLEAIVGKMVQEDLQDVGANL